MSTTNAGISNGALIWWPGEKLLSLKYTNLGLTMYACSLERQREIEDVDLGAVNYTTRQLMLKCKDIYIGPIL